jgi:GNAT superfamily N-acetyltransferase
MTIRFATLADIPALVQLGKHMHGLTRFKVFDYDEAKVAASLQAALESGQGRYVSFVAQDSAGQIAGGLLAVLEKHMFSQQLTASIMHYDVLPAKRMGGYGVRLLKAFELWCKNRQVVEINFGINSVEDAQEMQRLNGFAQKMGYAPVGANHSKTLAIAAKTGGL